MKTRLAFALLTLWLFAALPAGARATPAEDLGQLLAQAATYQPGQSLEPLRSLEAFVRQSLTEPKLRAQVEGGLVRLLQPDSSFAARRWACKQLGIIGSELALPALATLLQSEETAGIACLALSTYPAGKADELLRHALSGASGERRVQIINLLGDRRDAKAVRLLAQAAREQDMAVAESAVAALGKIGDPPAASIIAQLRHDGNPVLRPALTEATLRCARELARAGHRSAASGFYQELLSPAEPPYIRRSAFAGLLRLDKDLGEKRILAVLRGNDAVLKPVAIDAARFLSSPGATGRLAGELALLQPEEQVWLLESLAARGDAAARQAAAASLESPQSEVRKAAAIALGQLGDQSSVAAFARALARSSDPEESRTIEVALKGLRGGDATDQAIIAELKRASGQARAHLIAALAPRQGRVANELLLKEIHSSEAVVAKAAFRALANTANTGEIAALLKGLDQARDPEVRAEAEHAAAQALARIDAARRSIAVRDELIRAHTAESRCSFLGLLPACGGPAALGALKLALGDDDSSVRFAAVRALAEWPDSSAWDILTGLCRRPETEALRGLALRALVRLAGEQNSRPDAKLMDCYRELFDLCKSEADLRLVLGILGGAAHPDALALAVPLLDNAAVRKEAEVAIRTIATSIKDRYPEAAQKAFDRLRP